MVLSRTRNMQFTILVVDDDPGNIRVLSSLLKDDCRVLIAKSGNSAIDIAHHSAPHLILLDIVMPDMDGFEIIKQLKQSIKTQNIPIIFITGLNSDASEEQGLNLGACDYIHKPFHFGVVKARINNQLEILRRNYLLEKIANIDVLTELPNRRKWQDDLKALQQHWHKEHHLAIGILDVDYFKQYNDYYGHAFGDKALLKLAQTIHSNIASFGAKLYRFGGEEFVFMLYHQDVSLIETCINTICQAVEQQQIEHKASKVKPVITISGGACIQPCNDQISSKRMLEHADALLYQAKRQGKNRILLTHELAE